MPRVIITETAVKGLEHCRLFITEKNPQAAIRASQLIKTKLLPLETEPGIGRPLDNQPELREFIIPFGSSGYVALYHINITTNLIYILAFRHQKEARQLRIFLFLKKTLTFESICCKLAVLFI